MPARSDMETPHHLAGHRLETAATGTNGETALADPGPDEDREETGQGRRARAVRAVRQPREPAGRAGGRAFDRVDGAQTRGAHRSVRKPVSAATTVGW